MKITDIRITGLAGGTVEGGWADELKPEDDVHTIVEVLTDEGLVGLGSVYTSKALVEGAVRLLRPPRRRHRRAAHPHRPRHRRAKRRTDGRRRRQRAILAARLQVGAADGEDAGQLRRGLVRGSAAARRPGRIHRAAPPRPAADR